MSVFFNLVFAPELFYTAQGVRVDIDPLSKADLVALIGREQCSETSVVEWSYRKFQTLLEHNRNSFGAKLFGGFLDESVCYPVRSAAFLYLTIERSPCQRSLVQLWHLSPSEIV